MFQNRHFQPPKIRGFGLGRTGEKFVDSDVNSKSVTTLMSAHNKPVEAQWCGRDNVHQRPIERRILD